MIITVSLLIPGNLFDSAEFWRRVKSFLCFERYSIDVETLPDMVIQEARRFFNQLINLCREYFSFDNSLHQAFRGLNPNFRLECRYLERFPQLYDYMDYGDILSEYEKFRCEVVYRLPSFSMEIEEFCGECLKLNHLRKLSLFFTKIVTIPQSSAAVERLFSTLSATKTGKETDLVRKR